MDTNKNVIKTGFYSDYACEFFNCVKLHTAAHSISANSVIDRIFSDVKCETLDLLYPQTYEFKHAPNGEVILADLVTSCGFYFAFCRYSNANHLTYVALQIKLLVCSQLKDESAWNRENFTDAVNFDGKSFPIAEVYFIYDILMNHARSVNVFKSRHAEIASKIIGIPRDPITSTALQSIEERRLEVSLKYQQEIRNLHIAVGVYEYNTNKATQDLVKKLKTLVEEAKSENEKKISEIEAKRDAELKELETCMQSFQ